MWPGGDAVHISQNTGADAHSSTAAGAGLIWFVTTMLIGLAGSALADCKPLRMVGTTDFIQLPGEESPFIPVKFGDVSKLMILDTGAAWSMLSPDVKEELGLKGHQANMRMYDVLGRHTEQFVTTPMEFARLKNSSVKLMVLPAPIWDTKDETGKRVAGLLGADILGQFDLSIDFARKKIDLLDPDHCEGKVVYWGATNVAIVPFERASSGHIRLSVTLDGLPVEALLDTGASNSTLHSDDAVRRFGLTLGNADTPASGLLNGSEGVTTWRHRFKTLSFGGITMTNPEITIIPDKVSGPLQVSVAGGRITRAAGFADEEMLIGMNLLKHIHLYISYKEKKLYITPAETPVTGSPAH
jgi:predicted aspartyl protease